MLGVGSTRSSRIASSRQKARGGMELDPYTKLMEEVLPRSWRDELKDILFEIVSQTRVD